MPSARTALVKVALVDAQLGPLSAELELVLAAVCPPARTAVEPRDRFLRYWAAFWRWARGGRLNPWLSFGVGCMAVLYGLTSPSLKQACVGFVDASTMLLAHSYQRFLVTEKAETEAVLRSLLVLTRRAEALCARGDSRVQGEDREAMWTEIQNGARMLQFMYKITHACLFLGTAILVLSPIITGQLTCVAWPHPHQGGAYSRAYWWALLALQEVACFAAGVALRASMDIVLVSVLSTSALARTVAVQLKWCRSDADVVHAVSAHQAVLRASSDVSRHANAVLLPMVFGYLAVSLFGTYNLAGGRIDPYVAVVVPAALLFFFFLCNFGEHLETSLRCVAEQAAVVDVSWFSRCAVRGAGPGVSPRAGSMLVLVARCGQGLSRTSSLRVAWLGLLRRSSFVTVMRRWYSALQMMRNVH